MSRFWREIPSRYNLVGTKCPNCGRIFFPTRDMCPDCHRASIGRMEPYQLNEHGTVVTYTVIHVAQLGFEMMVPYVMAIVEMEGGVRMTSQIVDCEPSEVAIGTKVKAVFRRIGAEGHEGPIHYGYKFVLEDQAY
ncbi:MAG: Zn-ribbon domain-containing OB-fold protein [Thermoplasmata archaeon]|nr:Zn-ribbon domain-containing OB-fold protein [Thermoplasmata archaeon]